jgi:uncharacterized membrane protein
MRALDQDHADADADQLMAANGRGLSRGRGIAWLPLLAIPPIAHVVFVSGRLGGTTSVLVLSGLAHTVLYAGLLVAFGGSLLRGREPLVARFARRVHGELPAEIALYARGATIAWCVFCGGQLVASALLFVLASRDAWSVFVNILDLPLLALMFASEYVCRRLWFPHRAHIGLVTTILTFARRDQVMWHDG